MPGTSGVFTNVLQLGAEHCASCVRIFGRGAEGVAEACSRAAFARAHAPAFGHWCAVSPL
jgi:hypothetical protein